MMSSNAAYYIVPVNIYFVHFFLLSFSKVINFNRFFINIDSLIL